MVTTDKVKRSSIIRLHSRLMAVMATAAFAFLQDGYAVKIDYFDRRQRLFEKAFQKFFQPLKAVCIWRKIAGIDPFFLNGFWF